MKKLSALLSFLILFTAFTCEDEPLDGDFVDDINNQSNSTLVGEWNLESFDVSVNTVNEVQGTQIETDIIVDSFNPDYSLVFTSNAFNTSGSYSYNTEVTVFGQTTTDTYTLENVTGNGTYSTNGDVMTIDGSFFEFTFQGVDESVFEGEQNANFEITSDGQTLVFSENSTEVDDSNGLTVTITKIATSVWTRSQLISGCSLQAATDEAAAAYNNDTSNTDLCNAYKTALQNQIDVCGDDNGALQTIIDGLGDCSQNQSNNTLFLRMGGVDVDFDVIDVVVEDGLIKISGESTFFTSHGLYIEVNPDETGENTFVTFVLTTAMNTLVPYMEGTSYDFSSEVTTNSTGLLIGTFGGTVVNSSGGGVDLTNGQIDITY